MFGSIYYSYRDKNGCEIREGDLIRGSTGSTWIVLRQGLNLYAKLVCRHNPKAMETWWLFQIQCVRVERVGSLLERITQD
jgi:hypothetical protein